MKCCLGEKLMRALIPQDTNTLKWLRMDVTSFPNNNSSTFFLKR